MSESNRVLIKARPESGAIDLVQRALPALKTGEALVKIRFAGICGTDLHIVRWNEWAARSYALPVSLGHEFCGEVLETAGGESRFKPGDRVVAETHLPCGQCRQCRTGRGHTCEHLKVFSKLGQGCFSDFAVVPQALLRKVPAELPDRVACIMEPLGIALRAVADHVPAGASLLIVGCGPIGLLAITAARALGVARIWVSDPSSERRALASKAGADVAIDPGSQSLIDRVRAESDGAGADVSIDASGHSAGINDALAATATGGTLILTGMPAAPVALDLTRHVILREVAVRGLYGRCIDKTWLQMESLLRAGKLNVEPLLTHTFKLADYEAAFSTAAACTSGKVLLQP